MRMGEGDDVCVCVRVVQITVLVPDYVSELRD